MRRLLLLPGLCLLLSAAAFAILYEAGPLNPATRAHRALQQANDFAMHGHVSEALAAYNRAAALAPRNAEIFLARGLFYRDLNESEPAIRDLTTVLKLQPHFSPALAERGTLYGRLGDHRKAEADLNEAVRLQPNDMQIRTERAEYLAEHKEYVAALRDYDEIVRHQPKNTQAAMLRAALTDLVKGSSTASDYPEATEQPL